MPMERARRNFSMLPAVFRSFVCVALSLLLGLHIYAYLWGHPLNDSLDGDFSDIKYVVMQLTRGLTEVNRKHERLHSEMERISAALPAVAAAASRAKDAIEPSLRRSTRHRQTQDVECGDYDRQITDFALESAGARVIDTGGTVEHVHHESLVGWALLYLTSLMCRECLGARLMLRPGALPGECWSFKGHRGEALIRLVGTVHVTGVSVEHIPPQIAPTREISSAPRLFALEGVERKGDKFNFDFGTFEYDKEGKTIQYFDVLKEASKGFNMVRFKVLSNWGNPVFTCVYRVRIHGHLAHGQGPKAIQNDDELRIENE